jgi:predicted glycoside hydrolase/deacetylase ChbG (UPF0249 family)
MGFCHAANEAFERVLDEGLISAISLMTVTPWFEEAVEILSRHPEVSVGLHLALNSEWENYKWGPVLPVTEVPTLVDEWGHFHGTRAAFNEANPDPEEIEAELRAQVELALSRGVNLSYIDHHMGTAGETPERRAILERIARDNGLAISRWLGEEQVGNIYSVSPEAKADALLEELAALEEPGVYLVVIHPGTTDPEMMVLRDVHPWAPSPMAPYRAAETDALCDPRLRALIEERGFDLVDYNEIRAQYLDRLTNPDWEVPSAPDAEPVM